MALGVRLRKGTLLIALLLLVGLEAGSASGATERLEEVSSFGFDYRGGDLAWDGEHLWATDPNEDKIYKLDTSGNIISSFDSPGRIPYGLTWDGEHLWVTSTTRNRVYKVDTSGNLISSFGLLSDLPFGLTWDGEHLWVNDGKSPAKILEYDTSGNLVSSFDFGWTRGMTWDGEHLWAVDGDTKKIYKLDTSSNVITSFDPPSSSPAGLTWDGEHLWVSDGAENKIYQVRVTSYPELLVSSVPSDGGTVSLSPSGGVYSPGTQVVMTAEPVGGYMFQGWSGDVPSGHENDVLITVLMDSDKTLTAHFSKIGEPEGEEGVSLPWIGAGLAAVVLVIALILVLRRR